MSKLFQVDQTKEMTLWVVADDEQAAEDIAQSAADYCDWDYTVDSYEVQSAPNWAYVELEGDVMEWPQLVALREWIDAVEAAEAVDPNQGKFFE